MAGIAVKTSDATHRLGLVKRNHGLHGGMVGRFFFFPYKTEGITQAGASFLAILGTESYPCMLSNAICNAVDRDTIPGSGTACFLVGTAEQADL